MTLLVLISLTLLTSCSSTHHIIANDPHNECVSPEKPKKPYMDKAVAVFILRLNEAIEKCRALLNN